MTMSSYITNATPDSVPEYGYGDAAPDIAKYGYGDAAPDGYSDSSPTITYHKTQRRSSMKTSGQPRRSSIQYRDEVEHVVPGNRKVRRRNSIGFDNTVKVRCMEPIASQAENPEDLWFQEEEYDKMKEKSYKLVDLVKRYGASGFRGKKGSKKPCVRGLESLMTDGEGRNEKITNRYNAWDSVLIEQQRQMETGTFDDQALAESYMMNTIRSKMEAAKLAQQDEKEVHSSSSSRRRSCRRVSMY